MSRVICISLGFLIAAAWLFTDSPLERRHSIAQEPPPDMVKKWEYKKVKEELSGKELMQLGEEGWELGQVIPNAKFSEMLGSIGSTQNSTEFCAYFKRPK